MGQAEEDELPLEEELELLLPDEFPPELVPEEELGLDEEDEDPPLPPPPPPPELVEEVVLELLEDDDELLDPAEDEDAPPPPPPPPPELGAGVLVVGVVGVWVGVVVVVGVDWVLSSSS